ncbi:MAG TPA: hypothetical protein VEZ19_14640 [Rubrobacter sp.]|nr:hypothetical protein [Rubrobacter sp.]
MADGTVESSQRIAGSPPGVAVDPGVLLEVRDDLAGRNPRIPALFYERQGVEGGFVGVDLVPEQHQRLGQLPGPAVPQAHRHRVEGVHSEATLVLIVIEGVRRFVRGADAARAEDELDLLPFAGGPDHARREGRTRLRPDLLPVEMHLVLAGFSGLEARDVYEGVVVATDAERGRGTPEHLDLARGIGLDPDGRVAEEPACRRSGPRTSSATAFRTGPQDGKRVYQDGAIVHDVRKTRDGRSLGRR